MFVNLSKRSEEVVPVARRELNRLVLCGTVAIGDSSNPHSFLQVAIDFEKRNDEERPKKLTLLASTRAIAVSLSIMANQYSTSSFFPMTTQSM